MQRYKHVAVIGIDGMGNFNRLTDTPCMDRIFAEGALKAAAFLCGKPAGLYNMEDLLA